jgi:hypothetical protein
VRISCAGINVALLIYQKIIAGYAGTNYHRCKKGHDPADRLDPRRRAEP